MTEPILLSPDEWRELQILVEQMRRDEQALRDEARPIFRRLVRKFTRTTGLRADPDDPEMTTEYMRRRAEARPDISFFYSDVKDGFDAVTARASAITALVNFYRLREEKRIINPLAIAGVRAIPAQGGGQ